MFPPHFCYRISVLSCFRYVSGDVFFSSFFNPCSISHDQCFRNFALRTIKVNKGKFTLEIRPLNGSHAFFAHVALMQRL